MRLERDVVVPVRDRDVTSEQPAELELLDLIDRYRVLVELSPDSIVIHEAGVIRYVNPAAARLAHLSPEAMTGRSIVDFVHQDDLESTLARIMSLTEHGMVSETSTLRIVSAEGETFLVDLVSVRTTWEGRPAYQVIMRDVTEREASKAMLRSQAQLVESVTDAILSTDEHRRVTSWNPAAEQIFGWTAAEAIGHRIDLGFSDEYIAGLYASSGESRWSGEMLATRKDGTQVPIHTSMAALPEIGGSVGYVAVCSDQSMRVAAEDASARAQARFATVVAALDEGIAVVAGDGEVQALNPAAERIFGHDADWLRREIVSGEAFRPCDEDGGPLRRGAWPLAIARSTGASVSEEVVGVHRGDGVLVWLRMSVHPLDHDAPDGTRSVVCSFTDITEQRRAAAALSWAATHDELTGLPNRWAMTTQIEALLAQPDTRVAVLFSDLDRFKDVNDSLGHRVGDAVLCEVADRLSAIMRPEDMVGRLGGDEFLVLCTDVTEAEALTIADGVVAELSRPIEVTVDAATITVTLGASVGVASTDASILVRDVGEMLQAADAALYKAKERGRNRVEAFDIGLREEARRRLEMRDELRVALERDQLEVHYQPIWHTDADPGRCTVAGYEALVRWNHPDRGPQSPAEFIPVAEESGLISVLGMFVLNSACLQTVQWRSVGQDVYVSVNLSARQLSDPDLVPAVAAALEQSGLPPEALWLELTESALAEEGLDAAGILDALVGLGIRISIDDFGTGYSSLGRLRHFPVAALKVDQSFVADMTVASAKDGKGDGGAIAASTIALAHRLGLTVIAEGVETVEQLEALAALGCDLTQGYLLGRPVHPSKIVF